MHHLFLSADISEAADARVRTELRMSRHGQEEEEANNILSIRKLAVGEDEAESAIDHCRFCQDLPT